MARVLRVSLSEGKNFVYGIDLTDALRQFPPANTVMSEIGWGNPKVQAALNILFKVKPNEIILALAVGDQGIVAHVERK